LFHRGTSLCAPLPRAGWPPAADKKTWHASEQMPKSKAYEMAEEVKEHPVVERWRKDADADDGEDIMKMMDEFKKVAKTKDAEKKKALKALKKEFPNADAAELQAKLVEKNGKADEDMITEAEFVTAFTKGIKLKDADGQPIKVTGDDAKRLFKAADTSRDGFVSFNEFVCLMAVMQKGSPEKKLDLVFRIYDADKSGKLEEGEIRNLLTQMLTTEDADEKATQIDNVVKMVMEKDGADGSKADKKISQDELKQALADTGILTACMGQNIDFSGAVSNMYNKTVKSRACLVM